MATRAPVAVTQAWTLVYNGIASGAFTGSIQAAGNSPIIGVVKVGAPAPADGIGGITITGTAQAISVLGTESLWCRSSNDQSAVIIF